MQQRKSDIKLFQHWDWKSNFSFTFLHAKSTPMVPSQQLRMKVLIENYIWKTHIFAAVCIIEKNLSYQDLSSPHGNASYLCAWVRIFSLISAPIISSSLQPLLILLFLFFTLILALHSAWYSSWHTLFSTHSLLQYYHSFLFKVRWCQQWDFLIFCQ